MSPIIVACRPFSDFLCFRIVNASSSACEGCSCMPSPALMMGMSRCWDIRCGAPAEGCLMRTGSGGSFVKQKNDSLAAQQRASLQRIHAAGQLEQAHDFIRLQGFDAQERT